MSTKLKSHRGAAKRFRKSRGGLKRRRAYRNHILTKKTQKRKRQLRKNTLVQACDAPAIQRMLHGS